MEVTFSKKSGWLAKKVWKMHSEGIRIACLDFKIKLKKIYQVNIYIYIICIVKYSRFPSLLFSLILCVGTYLKRLPVLFTKSRIVTIIAKCNVSVRRAESV